MIKNLASGAECSLPKTDLIGYVTRCGKFGLINEPDLGGVCFLT